MKDHKEILTDMIEGMESFVQDGRKILEELKEAEEQRARVEKVNLNMMYGVTGSPMCRVTPCGYLPFAIDIRQPTWCRTARRAPMSLDFLSWAEIKAINNAGATMKQFQVGDTKTVQLKNGETITLRIIGLFHDKTPDGSLIPITWEMTHYLKDRHAMNDAWTNKGGWGESDMRRYLRDEILPLLPDDLRNILQTTRKETSAGSGSKQILATYDELFLLSEWERYGRCFYSACQEGKWYAWYAREGVSYAKTYPDGSKGWGWSRSPLGSGATRFCLVNSNGGASNNDASGSIGVAFGLCT